MKKVFMLLMVSVMLLSLAACTAEMAATNTAKKESASAPDTQKLQETASESTASGEMIKIGLSWCNMTDEYCANIYEQMVAYVEEKNMKDKVELIILDAGMDAAKQNSQVDNLISQGVKAIILIAVDAEQQIPAVKAAKAANIPLIELCVTTNAAEERSAYVGSDDSIAGKMLMEQLIKASGGKGNIVILHGAAGQTSEILRHQAAMELLKNYPEMKVVAEKICDYDRAKAMSAMENIIQSGMKVDILFSEDDGMALGALEAIKGSDVEGKIIVGGIDGVPDALQAVKDGRMVCSILQNGTQQGRTSFDVAMKAINGETLEKIYDVPFELITKENVEEFINK